MHYVNEFNHKKNMCMFAPVNVCVSACFFACISFGSASYLTQKLFSSLPSGRNTSHTHTHTEVGPSNGRLFPVWYG